MQEAIIAVQKMQDYIASHLNETITLTALSKVSFYSPWYSYRLFKEYTGLTPADYIRRLRLSKSALRLRDEDITITELAFKLGFQSIEGYQRAFRREFGCNPNEYAKHPVPIYLFIPYGVTYNELRRVHIKLEEVGCEVCGLLTSMHSISGEPVCLWLPEKYRTPGTSEYVQGVEVAVDYNEIIPDGFDTILLPEADYMMFQGEPFQEEEYCAAIEGVQEAIKRFDPTTRGYVWDTENPRIQLEPIGSRGYCEMLAVKKCDIFRQITLENCIKIVYSS